MKNLFRLLRRKELWVAAYRKLAGNKGALMVGEAKGTIDGTSMKVIRHLKDLVISGHYKVGYTRRVNIPKPRGSQRPLGRILRRIGPRGFENFARMWNQGRKQPRFSLQTQHTCLRQIRRDFGST